MTTMTTMTRSAAAKLRNELNKIDADYAPANIGSVKKIMRATLGGLVRKKKRVQARLRKCPKCGDEYSGAFCPCSYEVQDDERV